MSREIRFRAWNKVEHKMLDNIIHSAPDSFDMILKHPQVYDVMQFTGLQDMYGRDIYEGDILHNVTHIGFEYDRVVSFYQGSFIVQYIKENYFKPLYSLSMFMHRVIGNIYEG